MAYTHCVFCAARTPEQQDIINLALKAKANLEAYYDEEACITGSYTAAKLTIIDGINLEINAESNSLYDLISTCMDFATELATLTHRQGF